MNQLLKLLSLVLSFSCSSFAGAWGTGGSSAVLTTESAKTVTWSFAASTVTFHGRAALIDVDGAKSSVQGALVDTGGKLTGILTVDLRPLRTGNELRDSHMHNKYLQTEKYPTAKLQLAGVPLASDLTWCGQLTVKLDTQKVCGSYRRDGDKLEAEFKLDLKKIPSLGIPAWAGATLSDEVTVKVDATVIGS